MHYTEILNLNKERMVFTENRIYETRKRSDAKPKSNIDYVTVRAIERFESSVWDITETDDDSIDKVSVVGWIYYSIPDSIVVERTQIHACEVTHKDERPSFYLEQFYLNGFNAYVMKYKFI